MPDPIDVIRSPTLVLPTPNLDTDQIIPARHLVTTGREGLGQHLFGDWRAQSEYGERLDDPRAAGCEVLVTGANVGCGSSREHAAWALHDAGFRAVVSTVIADIFRANAIKNGLLPIVVDQEAHAWLIAHPWSEVVIDLDAQTLTLPFGRSTSFAIDPFSKHCLRHGIDELDFLMSHEDTITAFEESR